MANLSTISVQGTRSLGLDPTFNPYVGTQVQPTYEGSSNLNGLAQIQGDAQQVTRTKGDLQAIINQRGANDPIGQQAQALLQTLNNDPSVIHQPSYQQALDKVGSAVALAKSGGNPAALAQSSASVIDRANRPVVMPGASPSSSQQAQDAYDQVGYGAATGLENQWKGINDPWQAAIGGGVAASIAGRNNAAQQQNTDTSGYINALNGYYGQQQGYVNQANASDQAALGQYNSIINPQIAAVQNLQAPTWKDYVSNPQDVQRQQQAFDWASGAASGSLDYQAQLANYQTANYQTYDPTHAQLYQYASNPQDVQRQLTGLGNIEQDIATGGAGQEKILEQIYQDLQHGGDGQRDAIARLKQELATGGNDQREVMEKYKALSDPNITAQERYLAEIARRSFEAQDRGSREAVLSDQAARGVRSGASEVASSLANQERFGQDRTLAELGLQANAVGRSMQALGGWQQSADSLRAAQQNGLAMYTQANNALRAAQQNGMALAANEENALREAQQRGMAMYQQAADSIRAMNDQVGLANTGWSNQNSMFNANADNQANQFNANAYNENSMFNANAYNSNQQFNANANNTASANNQQARVQGGVAMNNTANSIRSANDTIGMFNTNGSQTSQQFAANLGISKAQTLNGLAQTQFGNTTGATSTAFGRNSGLTATGIGNAGAILGAQTTNNGIQGGVGSQNLGDILSGFGGATSGFGITSAVSQNATGARQLQLANAQLARQKALMP